MKDSRHRLYALYVAARDVKYKSIKNTSNLNLFFFASMIWGPIFNISSKFPAKLLDVRVVLKLWTNFEYTGLVFSLLQGRYTHSCNLIFFLNLCVSEETISVHTYHLFRLLLSWV